MSEWRDKLRTFRQKFRKSVPYLIVAALVFLFVVAYFFHRIFIMIPSGHAGVLFKTFQGGTEINTIYGEGLHLVAPWNQMTVYNTRVQVLDQEFDVLSVDGLAIKTTMTLRFHPTERLLGTLHKVYGPNYVNSYLLAELGSSARRVIGTVTPAQLYSSARDSVEQAIDDKLRWELREIEEFLTREWPDPPGYKEFLRKYLYAVPDSLRDAVYDSLNMRLVIVNVPDTALRKEMETIGVMPFYFQLYSRFDSTSELSENLSKQINETRDVLLDSDAEKETGLYDLQLDRQDMVIAVRFDSLKREYDQVQRQAKEASNKLKGVLDHYDRLFMLVNIQDVLIKSIVLPPQIAQAIENKLEQEQVAEEFNFRLTRERREADRKRIEAKGIKDFQDTVRTGITPDLLKWKGIEATLELAKSQNAKVIVIGAGEEGMPLILGNAP